MSEAGLVRLRTLVGWITAGICLCAVAALIDGFVASARTGPQKIAIVAGGRELLSGPIPIGTEHAAELTTHLDNAALTFGATTEFSGFWLGGRMWHGELRAAPDAAPGRASLTLTGRPGDQPVPPQVFTIRIFVDQRALEAASPSLIRRVSGLPPFAAAGMFFGLGLGCGGGVFLLSRRLEAVWRSQGKAVLYAAQKTPEGLRISFGLGTDQGLAPGLSVTVTDKAGQILATATVVRCTADDASALVPGETGIHPGQTVRLTPGQA